MMRAAPAGEGASAAPAAKEFSARDVGAEEDGSDGVDGRDDKSDHEGDDGVEDPATQDAVGGVAEGN